MLRHLSGSGYSPKQRDLNAIFYVRNISGSEQTNKGNKTNSVIKEFGKLHCRREFNLIVFHGTLITESSFRIHNRGAERVRKNLVIQVHAASVTGRVREYVREGVRENFGYGNAKNSSVPPSSSSSSSYCATATPVNRSVSSSNNSNDTISLLLSILATRHNSVVHCVVFFFYCIFLK